MKFKIFCSLVAFVFSTVIAEEQKILDMDVLENKTPIEISFDETTIVGSQAVISRITGSAHQIDHEELERFKYDDIHRVLSQVPGVYIREEDGYGLRPNIGFRGADSNRSKKVVLMEDGVLFGPAPYSAPAAYYFPVTSRMTGVEVFKGPSAIQFGPNTIGGAINLKTRPVPFEKEGELDIAYGADQYGKLKLHYGDRKGQWGYLFDIVHLRTDGFKDLDNGGDTGFDKTEAMLKLQWESDYDAKHYQRLSLKLGYSEEESNETYLGLSDADFSNNPHRRYSISQDDLMDWDRNQIQLSHVIEFNESFNLSTRVYRHDFSRSWAKVNSFTDGKEFLDVLSDSSSQEYRVLTTGADTGAATSDIFFGNNQRDYLSQGIQSDGIWTLNTKVEQTLKLGLRYHTDEIVRNHDETQVGLRSGDLMTTGSSNITRQNHDETKAISFYMIDEIKWRDWIFTPGLRFESMDMTSRNKLTNTTTDRSDTVTLFGAGFNYLIDENWTLLGGAHQGYSPVSPGQVDLVEEERSLNYEFGTRYHRDSFQAEVIGFFNDYSNLLSEETLSTGGTTASIGNQFSGGEVDVYGVELTLSNEYEFNNGSSLPVKLNYTFTDTEFKNTFASSHFGYDRVSGNNLVLAGESLPYVPENILQMSIGWSINAWSLNLNSKYQSEMQEIASADKTDAFWNFDFAGDYQWGERKSIYLKIDNIFDETHIASRRPYGARPGKPRQWQIGFSHKL